MSAVAIKAVSTGGLATASYRLWFAIPPLLLTLLAPAVRKRLDREWLLASLIGGTLFALHQILYFISAKLTSVTNVTIIGALQPALVLLLAGPLFGERASGRAVVLSGVAFLGTALVMLGSDHSRRASIVGDVLAVVNLFAFTAYFLASKRFRERVRAWDYVVGMTTVSGLIVTVLTLGTRQDLGSPAPWEWATLVWLAIFPGTLGHVLTNWAHAYVPAFVSSMILLAVPVIAAAGAHVVVDEHIGALQIVGGAVVLSAIATIIRSTRRPDAEVIAEGTAFTEAP
jgi:drug/metabolite transporter (DMT)-like permease